MIINDTSEEVDNENNPVINPHNLKRGSNYRADGETESAVAGREKVYLSGEEWRMIKAAVNHGTSNTSRFKKRSFNGVSLCLASVEEASAIRKKQDEEKV
jgi:hypothetical protein